MMKNNSLQHRRTLLITATSLFVLFILSFSYGLLIPRFHPTNKEGIGYLYLDKEANLDSITGQLSKQGYSSSAWPLKCLLLITPSRTGRFAVHNGENLFNLYRRIRNRQQAPLLLVINTPRTLPLLAQALGKQLMLDSAEIITKLDEPDFAIEQGFTKETLPAMFIPNSYEVYWNTTLEDLMTRLHKEYNRFWTNERKEKAKALGLTPVQVSTLASVVDSETAYDPEKPSIAALYLNRLRLGMKLQADPTVIFAAGDFSIHRVGGELLKNPSPYNTYQHEGLPPGPIRIPSIAGIDAVLTPDSHAYIYMCAKEDFSGSHNFAMSLGEHRINAGRFQQALNARNIQMGK